ncbi:MAG: hypothetical protein IT438_05560 [Phycisphaerales bacterium]|nr:hypothetical protein [Phycisphaerales bacterium]
MRTLFTAIVFIPCVALADPPASIPQKDALAGPKVGRKQADDRTLVQREFDGRLKRLEIEPVGAAVALLGLSPEEKQAAEKVLVQRKTALDALIRDNIPLVLRLDGAFKGADGGQGQKALQELFEKARPIFEKGLLIDQVAGALTPAHAKELRRLHAEYMAAAVEDRINRGEQKDRFGARVAEGFTHFQLEVEDSGKRVFESGDKEFKELVHKLDLTAEQESKIQGMFLDLYANSMGKPDKGKAAVVMLKSLGLLTEEQKVKLRQIIAEEARSAAKAKRAAKNPAGK